MERRQWRIASASETGTSHIGNGLPCQDSAAQEIIDTEEGPVLIAVVCDGAGSAPFSDVGSLLAAHSIVEAGRAYLHSGGRVADIDRNLMVDWLLDTVNRLSDRAQEEGHSPRDYACTLLVAITGEDHAVFAQIGDGAIVVSHGEADGWSWVFWPQHGAYANQTNFILSENAVDALEFSSAPRAIDEFAMFSDGIERMVLHAETRAVNDAFFDQMFMPVRTSQRDGLDAELSAKLKGYLGSELVNARTNDDKTLIMATRRRRQALEK